MSLIVNFLLFLGGFSATFCFLKACAYCACDNHQPDSPPSSPPTCSSGCGICFVSRNQVGSPPASLPTSLPTSFLCRCACWVKKLNRSKIFQLIGIIIAIITVYYVWLHGSNNYNMYDLTANPNFGKAFLFVISGAVASVIFKDFVKKVVKFWGDDININEKKFRPILIRQIVMEATLLVLVCFGTFAAFGMNPSIKTDYFTFGLSSAAQDLRQQYFYEIKDEGLQRVMLIEFAGGIPCAMKGDEVFFKIAQNHNAMQTVKDSHNFIDPLLILLQRSQDALEAGEPKERVAEILHPVKISLVRLLLDIKNVNDKEIMLFFRNIKFATIGLSSLAGYKNSTDKNYPYSIPTNITKKSWCSDLFNNDPSNNDPSNNEPRINEKEVMINDPPLWKNSEAGFKSTLKLPYLYLVTAIFRWYDDDTKNTLDMFKNKLTEEGKDLINSNIAQDINFLRIHLIIAGDDFMSTKELLKHTKNLIKANNDLLLKLDSDKIEKGLTNDILKKRYNRSLVLAKNDWAYETIRSQETLNYEDIDEAIASANEAYKSDKDNFYFQDTLGYVRMVAVQRGRWDGDKDMQIYQAEDARRLLVKAYESINEGYEKNPNSNLNWQLKLVRGHMHEAEKLLAQLQLAPKKTKEKE